MGGPDQRRRRSRRLGDPRAALAARLEARRPELEQAVTARMRTFADPADVADPLYGEGLRTALSASLDYGIAAVELGEDRSPSIPATLRSQARLAARNGISLATVLRRYIAGNALLGDFVIEAAEKVGLRGNGLQSVMREQAALFEGLIAAVSEEYKCESEDLLESAGKRRAKRIRRLLAGEPLDTGDLAYEFEAWHLGIVAAGAAADEAIRDLATALDRQLLLVQDADGIVWSWLGGRRKPDRDELTRIGFTWPALMSISIGEPAHGLPGWRLTHRQAQAALPVAMRKNEQFVRYADVAVLASMLQDSLLTTSLRELYLVPLEQERDGGEVLRETLRAYFAAELNVSSTAAALGVNRRTVANRLHRVEAKLGSLSGVMAQVEAALSLQKLDLASGDEAPGA